MASKLLRNPPPQGNPGTGFAGIQRSVSMESFKIRVYLGAMSRNMECLVLDALKTTTAAEIVKTTVRRLTLGNPDAYELAETFSSGGHIVKERRLVCNENPVRIQIMWPRVPYHAGDAHRTEYHFYLVRQEPQRRPGSWMEYSEPNPVDTFLSSFLHQHKSKEYQDLCNLPDLNEHTLLENLHSRFENSNIYTYVGSILIALNPFKFYPIYNPKYVKMYQNRRLGELPPHIFAIADSAYHKMLADKCNQCIVISGESGSGKTESTNLLLHHLSALTTKGVYGGGVEQTILGAGPVLEAFGNSKTVHNNNSSRFGKFIQVNYKENGMVHGAVIDKYLLEKSRIVSQAKDERNYHVFYYLLAGANSSEREALQLTKPQDYFYLNQSNCLEREDIGGESIDEAHEFIRLKQSMEMVGFGQETQRRILCVLASVIHLGNLEFQKKPDHRHHEAVTIKNKATLQLVSSLLKVHESTLTEALTKRKTMAGGETVVMAYNMAEAIATRDAMAKCLYAALFDWIVLHVNQALFSRREYRDHKGNSIGVLDIFGFEDFDRNSFEQFCINYANEHLHYYFNQHIFRFEQEEYVREGIEWKNIEFIDNTACLHLFSKKPTGLLYLIDEESNFPGGTNETLLRKFHASHQNHAYYEAPQMKENSFSIVHYAGKVKYQIRDFREKNCDLIRNDIVVVLKNSSLTFVRELVGYDPVAVLRWSILRAFFRAFFAFKSGAKQPHRKHTGSRLTTDTRQSSPGPKSHHISLPGDMSKSEKIVIIGKSPHASLQHVDPQPNNSESEDLSSEDDEDVFDDNVPHQYIDMREMVPGGDLLSVEEDRVMKRASRVLMKSKSGKPRKSLTKGIRDLKSLRALSAGRTVQAPSTKSSIRGKNKPPSMSAQFNASLSKLLETLNQANPFFIRCIKSNAEKAPLKFDNALVLRQLRYTGMLATVKIRQSGYNYRLTFEEFIQQYSILLPKRLLSSKEDVSKYLNDLDLNNENYQIGKTKVFLRETEKLLLDDTLHQAIMKRIIFIQRWTRATLDRQRYLRLKSASIVLQCHIRGFIAQRRLHQLRLRFYAAILVQKVFRGFRARKRLRQQNYAAVQIQRMMRGYSTRKRYVILKREREIEIRLRREEQLLLEEKQRLEEEEEMQKATGKLVETDRLRLHSENVDLHSSASDEGVLTPKGFSSEELLFEKEADRQQVHDSESSGILDDLDENELHASHTPSLTPLDRVDGSEYSEPTTPAEISPTYSDKVVMTAPPPEIVLRDERLERVGRDILPLHDLRQIERIEPSPTRELPPMSPKVQDGPQDIEILIHPAIQSSEDADSSISEYQYTQYRITSARMKEIKMSAPLAREESLSEKDKAARAQIVKRINVGGRHHQTLEEYQARKKQEQDKMELDAGIWDRLDKEEKEELEEKYSLESRESLEGREILPGTMGTGAGIHRSPFHRAKKHFKNFMADCLATVEDKGPPKRPHGIVDIGDVYGTKMLGDKSASLPAKMESVMLFEEGGSVDFTHTHTRVSLHHSLDTQTKIAASQGTLSRHTKISFKRLLDSKCGRRKKEHDEDSDDSQGEESLMSPPINRETPPLTPVSPKIRDSWVPDYLEPNVGSKPKRLRKNSKKRKEELQKEREKEKEKEKPTLTHNTWSVSSTSQWQYPTDLIVSGVLELQQLINFVLMKKDELSRDMGRLDSVFDLVFKDAMSALHVNLITQLSVALQDSQTDYQYKDMMILFEKILGAKMKNVKSDDTFPITMGINAFRGFMDEFVKKKENKELPEVKVKSKKEKKKKEKKDSTTDFAGHKYIQVHFSIPTFCEFCNALFWVERGYVCQDCKYTIHKKCYTKSTARCKGGQGGHNMSPSSGKAVFGAHLENLVGTGRKIPYVIERLIAAIELNGIYTEGIYRKPGAAAKIRQLIKDINTDQQNIDFLTYPIHCLTSVMKTFFRELPEPLLTFEFYDDFIRATECRDESEKMQSVFAVIDKLPQLNHDLLERLVFHLVNVAEHEADNKMNCTTLAIIFAPTILRTNRPLPAQESLMHVPKQTSCIQTILLGQMNRVRHTLADIKTLDSATSSAADRLCEVRTSKSHIQKDKDANFFLPEDTSPTTKTDMTMEERMLSEQIQSLQQEKDNLTMRLPNLECRHSSSEEDLLSNDDLEELDASWDCEHEPTFEEPAVAPPKNMRHLVKKRVQTPSRRPPTKKRQNSEDTTDGEGGDTPSKKGLSPPPFQQVGEEILV